MWIPEVGDMVTIKTDAKSLDGKIELRGKTYEVVHVDKSSSRYYVELILSSIDDTWWVGIDSLIPPEGYDPILEKIALMEKRFKKKQVEKKQVDVTYTMAA